MHTDPRDTQVAKPLSPGARRVCAHDLVDSGPANLDRIVRNERVELPEREFAHLELDVERVSPGDVNVDDLLDVHQLLTRFPARGRVHLSAGRPRTRDQKEAAHDESGYSGALHDVVHRRCLA